jgi:hypothetical protein
MQNLVKVLIRKDSYDIVSMETSIDSIDSLIYSPECFLGHEDALNEYINNNKYKVVDTSEPVGEGIVVFDLKTRTLIVATDSYVSKKPSLYFDSETQQINYANSDYKKQEVIELLQKGYLKSLNAMEFINRLSFTGVTDYEEFEKLVYEYCQYINENENSNSFILELEIQKNHFDRYFWSNDQLHDVRLKMKELGIVFYKKDEELWSKYLEENNI